VRFERGSAPRSHVWSPYPARPDQKEENVDHGAAPGNGDDDGYLDWSPTFTFIAATNRLADLQTLVIAAEFASDKIDFQPLKHIN
jgi:hypothetical protein